MGTYFTIVTCRNSENDIEKAIKSLSNQTIQPSYIIVIDDGSKDNTGKILKELSNKVDNLYIISNPDLGYDISRIVKNWNKALILKAEKKLEETDYHMIGTDDTIYNDDYAEIIIEFLDNETDYAIVSGNIDDGSYKTPRGAGRFVKIPSFIKNTLNTLRKWGMNPLF